MCHTDCTAQTHFLNVLKSVLCQPVLQICGSKVQKWAKVRRFYGNGNVSELGDDHGTLDGRQGTPSDLYGKLSAS